MRFVSCALVAAIVPGCFLSDDASFRFPSRDAATDAVASRDAGPTCPFATSTRAPNLGFVAGIPSAGTSLEVHLVDDDSLELTSPSTGSAFAFEWRGPPLPFVEGETVTTIGTPASEWIGITSASGTALVRSITTAFVLTPSIPALPTEPPIFVERAPLCSVPGEGLGVCDLAEPPTTFHFVGLSQLDQFVTAAPGETSAEVFGFRLTNVTSFSSPSGSSTTCVVEGFAGEVLTVIGP